MGAKFITSPDITEHVHASYTYYVLISLQHVGVQAGDVITAIGDRKVRCLNHKQVSRLIQESGQSVTLTLLSAVSPSTILHVL